MYGVHPNPRDRLISAGSAATLCAVVGYALSLGLGVRMPAVIPDAPKTFAVVPVPPTPPPDTIIPRPAKRHRPEGAASPANLRAKATEAVVPKPIVPPIVLPPPVTVALKPGPGREATTGAAPILGPGTGAGGEGNGTGSGHSGDGDGDGGAETPPKLINGRFKTKDFPNAEAVIGAGGIVGVRYTVETDGSVTQCRITRSSGNGVLRCDHLPPDRTALSLSPLARCGGAAGPLDRRPQPVMGKPARTAVARIPIARPTTARAVPRLALALLPAKPRSIPVPDRP